MQVLEYEEQKIQEKAEKYLFPKEQDLEVRCDYFDNSR